LRVLNAGASTPGGWPAELTGQLTEVYPHHTPSPWKGEGVGGSRNPPLQRPLQTSPILWERKWGRF